MSASRELVDGRYEIIRPLGRGGMGEVLLARQLNLDRLVVLKRAVEPRAESERDALADEARVAARLHHPNIVSIFDVVDRELDPVVVMELVVGVSLREVVERAPHGMPVEVALAIAIDILRGLAFAHDARVVHRDVNPRNVMVTFAGTTKLIDFGISQWLDHRQATSSVSGTRGYMPPEQQRGEPVDGRADQYAVGVTLQEMLTGQHPDEPARAIAQPELAAIVACACAEAADARFESCSELLLAIEDHLAARGIAATATHVERYVNQLFADKRSGLERDVETLPPPRARRPTPVTVASAKRDRVRISFRASNHGDARDAWLVPVIERLTRRGARDHGARRFTVASSWEQSAIGIELGFGRDGGHIHLEATRTDTSIIASATAPSVVECVEAISAELVRVLGEGLPASGPDADEIAAMTRLGAPSFEAFLAYRAAIQRCFAFAFPDVDALAAITREHHRVCATVGAPLCAARVPLPQYSAGAGDDRHRARDCGCGARSHRRTAPRSIRTRLPGRGGRRVRAVRRGGRERPTRRRARVQCRAERGRAPPRRRSERLGPPTYTSEHPELVFGVDHADAFLRSGRSAQAETVIREWVALVPENVAARVELARIEASAGRIDVAAAHARDALLVVGERGDALPELFDAAVASEQYALAEHIADRMLLDADALTRARGRYRRACVAVFEGRFAAAFDSARRATDEHGQFGMQSELVQCLELSRALAPLVGDPDAQRRYTRELVDGFATIIGDLGTAAATRYELALLERRGAAPSVDEHLAGLAEGPARDVARRRMLRAAAIADCGSVHKAVAAGFSAFEENAASLVALGICAAKLREHELARRCLERASQLWSTLLSNQSCAYHAVLARFHLAGVRAELGDVPGARAMYESFVRCWANADRPIAEVAIARQMLAHL